ncbi:hypothetical protein EJB05_40684, partial [Eragrostis curvula]
MQRGPLHAERERKEAKERERAEERKKEAEQREKERERKRERARRAKQALEEGGSQAVRKVAWSELSTGLQPQMLPLWTVLTSSTYFAWFHAEDETI